MNTTSSLCLLPQPKSIALTEGVFMVDDNTSIVLEAGTSPSDLAAARRLKDGLLRATGFDAAVLRQDRSGESGDIVLKVLPDEGQSEDYRIRIDSNGVEVEGSSSAGLRYGVETLLQIVNQHGIDLPAMNIEDSPDFPVRGLYHDVTRGQVPTLETMKQLADRCVAYKINHLELYIEHSFLFRSMREIGAGMDPISAEEILELDTYCRERHIDLVPSISTFGHMYEVLRTRTFHHLNELDIDAGKLRYNWRDRMMHYTLDVNNPESIALV
ncbi:MAG TPA: beta-N-acetylhexosaminidase, partial [Armatimonadota bacterium]